MARALQAALVLAALAFSTIANGQSGIRCSLIRAQGNRVVITWEAAPGRTYTLEETSSLQAPWRRADTYLAATNRLAANLTISERTRFFRILQSPRSPNLQAAGAIQTGYAFDPRFANYYQNSAEVPQRVLSIDQQLKDKGLIGELAPIAPVPDAGAYIAMVHTPAHIQGIHSIPIDQSSGATERIGVIAELAVAHVLGAVREVCEGNIRNAFCNIRPPGHHQINSGFSYGFCCHANVVIAARFALDRYPHLIKRVMIVDWDYHHGNGTQFFVQDDPAFLFYDTCAGGFYSGGNEALHGLMSGNPGNDGFLREWENEMLPLAKEFKPDLIFISAGFDSKKGDLMSGLGLTARGYSLLTRKVMDIADAFGSGRVVSILEGGYADNNGAFPPTFEGLKQAVENHVRTLMTGELQPETPYFY
jgi:acetoin utilization deacetylase AcuC-like enzyme